MTIATDEAVQMLEAGWTVRYIASCDVIRWRSPDGFSTDSYVSTSLDKPPVQAVKLARKKGHIVDRMRASMIVETHFLGLR